MKKITIINYDSGNTHSAVKAVIKAASDCNIEADIKLTNNLADIQKADNIILPGVGSYGDCISGIEKIEGLKETILEQVQEKQKNFLGICVGMQLLSDFGFEDGKHQGLGIIQGDVIKFNETEAFKIPHMGWNNFADINSNSKLLKGIEKDDDFYYVHSYHFETKNDADCVAKCNYNNIDFCAVIEKDNIFGTQFHPEKSQANGLKLLSNFVKL